MDSNTTEVVRRQKKPFLGLINRRSSKIEPQQNISSDDLMLLGNHNNPNDDEPLLNNQSQQLLGNIPSNTHKPGLFNKKMLERNNTFPSLNTTLHEIL